MQLTKINDDTSWEIDGETVETVSDLILGGSQITADGDCSHEIKRRLLLGRKVMTTGKTIALTRQTLVGKVMSLFLNILSRLVITFLPRSKHLLISWLQSPSAVILEPQKINSATVSTVSPSIFYEVMGLDAMIFTFCHKGSDICISEVIGIFPGNLDSSLCFFQSSISHDVLCIEVK